MWVTFYATMACAVAFLLVPGYLVARGLRADRYISLMIAPMTSIGIYSLLAIFYGSRGITCGWISMAIPVSLFGMLLCVLNRIRSVKDNEILCITQELKEPISFGKARISYMSLSIIVAILTGIGLTYVLFIGSLSKADDFVQNYDNAWHLTHIADFMNSGNYSTFANGSYPSAWHGVVAMAGSAMHATAPLAENAVNATFTAIVYPLMSLALLSTLFKDSGRRVLLGAAFFMSIAFFPWRIMMYGPMFPNMASFVVMPSIAALFIRIVIGADKESGRLSPSILFLIGGIALSLLQPNAVFSTGVFLIPFCMSECRRRITAKRGAKAGIVAEVLLLLVFAGIWIALVYAPPLHDVVWYQRAAKNDVVESIKWTLALNFVIRRLHFMIGILVIVGGIVLLFDRERRWLTFSYLMLASIFVVADGVPGIVKNIVAGFWYSDYWRAACAVCVFAVPLLATGVDTLLKVVTWPLRHQKKGVPIEDENRRNVRVKESIARAVSVLLVSVMLIYNYYPFKFIWWGYRVYAFDTVRYNFWTTYGDKKYGWVALTPSEIEFIQEANEIVPEGKRVMNMPFDGSVFAYSVYGLDVMYPQYGMDPGNEGKLLKSSIDKIATDESLQEIASNKNIGYLIQLDQGDGKLGVNEDGSIEKLGYSSKEWAGVNAVRDDTPGFTVVLSKGDMRLYQIDAMP